MELLERLLQGKIKAQTRTNLVRKKKYSPDRGAGEVSQTG
ncbi:MAG: hypothetical protein V4819_26550 [Verrucomicrobiota bacterium]